MHITSTLIKLLELLTLISQTASATSFVIMAAAKYPEEQAKVQAEFDSVVGKDRSKSSYLRVHLKLTTSKYRHLRMGAPFLV